MAWRKAKKAMGDWEWVGKEARSVEEITDVHRERAAGLNGARCVFSRVDDKGCTEKRCKESVGCLNHLGADKVLKLDKEEWIEDHLPEKTTLRGGSAAGGLRNLGATCYANAYLQLWYYNPALRDAVYQAVTSDSRNALYHLGAIFASLDLSRRQVIDPTPLLDRLEVDKGLQQDAAEFGKLFQDFIANEFRKLPDQQIKTLMRDLFEGRLESSIRCLKCGTTSKREEAFQELDITLKNGWTIEDCLKALSAEETLSGDNKYACQVCQSPQIAVKSLKPSHLPPILNLSLVRFTYDGMNRVKSKAAIKYAKRLVLQGHEYELRGVLTHLGTSAHHGHFVCDVYDQERDLWLHCNDEVVDIPDRKKRRRVDSPELDMESSKDAYMLVYYRKSFPAPRPPSRILQDVVEKDNFSLQDEDNGRGLQREIWGDEYDHVTGAKRDIIRVLPGRERLVPRSELAKWMQKDLLGDMFFPWDWSSITCDHRGIDPAKASDARLISEHAFDKLAQYTPLPDLSICSICVDIEFTHRISRSNHADCIAEYDRLSEGPYIVSKRWIDDWKRGQAKGGPTDEVYCEHGGRWDRTKIYKISDEAIALLRSIEGDFDVFKDDEPVCGVCAEGLAKEREAEAEDRQLAKEEKGWKRMISPMRVFGQRYYVLPSAFVEDWLEWIRYGGDRPTLDMALCKHGALDWDPMMKPCQYVPEALWTEICKRYGDAPPVVITFGANPLPGKRRDVVTVDPPVCDGCRVAKALDFEEATIYIIREESIGRSINGKRSSRTSAKEFEMSVKKTTTVKDIKVEICQQYGLSPISQRLFYADIELDSAQTVESLGIMADDRIRLQEVPEIIELDDDTPTREGFGGSVLQGRKACHWCTFDNSAKAKQCEVCGGEMI